MDDALKRIDRHTELLLRTAAALDDVAAPSLCAGWSRGHILSHTARNADAIATLASAALDGTGATMYPSAEQRDADIEAGAARPIAEQLADITTSAATLADLLARLGPEHAELRLERTPGSGTMIRIANLADMRLREVVYHHVDLLAGFGFADVEPDLLHRFLVLETRMLDASTTPPALRLRTDEGEEWVIGPPDGVPVSGSRAALLGWLARGLTDGVTSPELPQRTWG